MSLETTEILERLKEEPIVRTFAIERSSVDEDARTVELAFASDKPIDHWFGKLCLSMKKGAMRTERLESGAPLLMDHNWTDVVGVVETYSIGNDGVARAVVRFGESARAEEIFRDVRTGIRKNVSVGFMVHEMHLESSDKKTQTDTYRSDDFEPFEISLVAVPADISVGVGRAAELPRRQYHKDGGPPFNPDHSTTERKMNEETNAQPAAPAVDAPVQRTAAEIALDAVKGWAKTFREIGQTKDADVVAAYIATSARDGQPVSEDGMRAALRAATPATPTPAPMDPQTQAARNGAPAQQFARIIPRHGRIRNFSGSNETEKAEKAYRFGQWFLAGPMARKLGNSPMVEGARKFCTDQGLLRTVNESVNADGGFLVPDEFGNDLIDLRERYGVFRRFAKIVPMSSDRRTDPAISGFVPTYFPEEEGEITAGDLDFGQVGLTAKKLAALVPVSNEWNDDSIVNGGDLVAGEIGKGFAYKEDLCGFVGDGTSTYGRIVGLTEKLKGVDGTIGNIAGLKVGAGNAYSELLLTDFEGVVALLPEFADSENAKWFVSRKFYFNVMAKLAYAAAGNAASDIVNGLPRRFLGYEVVFTQVMPSTEANSQVCAVLADLGLGASMGSRHDTRIAVSEHSRFKYDMLEIRGTERFDINPHGVGDTTAAGPIVGLITAAA